MPSTSLWATGPAIGHCPSLCTPWISWLPGLQWAPDWFCAPLTPSSVRLWAGAGVEVSGAVRDLAAWMAGRSMDGHLHTTACELPVLGPWPPDPAD